MKQLEIKNYELIELLNDTSNWFKNIDKSILPFPNKKDDNEYYTSEEHLNEIDVEKHDGFPKYTYGVDIAVPSTTPGSWRKKILEIDNTLNTILGSQRCAVKMYYPKDGYMSWHNNHNASGHNILFSYTEQGDGWFKYKDPKTSEIVTMYDEPGWTAKVGYFGSNKEKDKIFWHCARAYEDRLTLGFVIPDQNMWEMMCDDIQDQ